MNRGFIAPLIVVLSLAGCAYQSAASYPSYPVPSVSVDAMAAGLARQECFKHVKPKTKQFSDCVAKTARSKRIRAAALRMHRHDAETYSQRVQQYQMRMQMDQFQQQQQQAAWQNATNTYLQMQAQQRASMPPPRIPTTTDCRVIGGNTLNCTSY